MKEKDKSDKGFEGMILLFIIIVSFILGGWLYFDRCLKSELFFEGCFLVEFFLFYLLNFKIYNVFLII